MYGQKIKRVLQGADISCANPPACQTPFVAIPGNSVSGVSRMEFSEYQMLRGTALIGATGSGKSYCGKRLLSEFRRKMPNNSSMVIIQAKDDFNDLYRPGDLVLEQGMQSAKSVRWNVFEDILCDGYDWKMIELNTREFVKFLFADKRDSREKFFVEGASELLYCVMISYIKQGMISLHGRCRWSNKGLRDFFLSYDEEAYLNVLKNCGEPGVLNRIMGNDTENRQALGVWGELVTTMLQTFVDVFAEEGDFSIRRFIRQKDGRVLFLNYDPSYRDTQVQIYGSLVNIMLKEVLSQNAVSGRTVLFCDELSAMGKTFLADAVNLGRAKGLIVLCGMQSVEQVYSIYGEHDGQAMLAGLCNKLYFKPGDASTRKYMQEDFGRNIADYMILSPGGCCSERREGYVLEDEDILGMKLGDCYVKNADGDMYWFHAA